MKTIINTIAKILRGRTQKIKGTVTSNSVYTPSSEWTIENIEKMISEI